MDNKLDVSSKEFVRIFIKISPEDTAEIMNAFYEFETVKFSMGLSQGNIENMELWRKKLISAQIQYSYLLDKTWRKYGDQDLIIQGNIDVNFPTNMIVLNVMRPEWIIDSQKSVNYFILRK